MAVTAIDEDGTTTKTTWAQLREQVAALGHWLREMGVRRGDRVVGYLPNTTPTLVAGDDPARETAQHELLTQQPGQEPRGEPALADRLGHPRFGQLPGDLIDYTPTEPMLVVELDADVCFEHDRWRHPTGFRRIRGDLQPMDLTTRPARDRASLGLSI